jgi:hypothetical protein
LKNRTERWVKEWSAKEEKELPGALKVFITYEQGGNGKMEIPLELLIPMPAYQFENVMGGQFRPLQRLRPTGP